MRALIIEELTFFNNALHMSIKSRINKEKKIKDHPIVYLCRIQGISVCINWTYEGNWHYMNLPLNCPFRLQDYYLVFKHTIHEPMMSRITSIIVDICKIPFVSFFWTTFYYLQYCFLEVK